MNRLSTAKRTQVVSALVEGMSVRATCRMTGVAKGTVLKLLVDLGGACAEYQDRVLRDLPCKRMQADEAWSFCYAKQRNVPAEHAGEFGYGDVWTWVAMDADTKLIPSWIVGRRDAGCAHALLQDLAGRLAGRIQLTTDGLRVYIEAVEDAFGADIDYAMLVTNAFSKKVENLAAAVCLYAMHYNFARPHQTLHKATPAMAAGIADHVWSIEEIVGLLDAPAAGGSN
jgi:hypothetical protein